MDDRGTTLLADVPDEVPGPDDEDVVAVPPDDPWVATRRLCAGVHLDREFRQQVIREVYNNKTSRVAPAYGFDMAPVVRHAWRAWRRDLYGQLFVVAVLVGAAVVVPLAALSAIGVLLCYYALRALTRLSRDYVGYLRTRRGIPGELAQLKSRLSYDVIGLVTSLLLVGAAQLTSLRPGHDRLRVLSSTGRWPMRGTFADAALVLALVLLPAVVGGVGRQYAILRLRDEETLEVPLLSGRLQQICFQSRHPFTVFGSYKPFIGAGRNVLTWSFAQRLVHAKPDGGGPDKPFERPPFTTRKLIRRLRRRIRSLESHPHEETRLPNLKVSDHVFLEGRHANHYLSELTNLPSRRTVNSIIAHPSGVARHQLACRVKSWGGEVVTTVFVHVSLQGRTLYIEFSTYALLPTRPDFQAIDDERNSGTGAYLRSVGRSMAELPGDLVALPVRLVGNLRDLVNALRVNIDPEFGRPRVNIGAKISIRELAAVDPDAADRQLSERGRSYFQYRDVVKFSKIIERQLLAAVAEFLTDHKVDTEEFWQRAVAILNQGVINQGTQINIGSAQGYQPTVSTSPTAPTAPAGSAPGTTN